MNNQNIRLSSSTRMFFDNCDLQSKKNWSHFLLKLLFAQKRQDQTSFGSVYT